MRCNDVLCTLRVWISENTQYCYCQPFTFLTHFSQFTLRYSQWITNISPLFPAKYFPMLMICWCLDDTELWTWDWWLWGSECPQWVVSVLDKYRVSLSLSHHPNIIITGWYRDSRSHQTMQTEHIFSVKLFCLFVWMFCTRVIGMQSTLCLCSRRSFIYGLTPSVTRSKTWDPRIKMWLPSAIITWPRDELNISPGLTHWHRVIASAREKLPSGQTLTCCNWGHGLADM